MSKKPFFEKIRNSRATRIFCAFIALNILIEIVSPTVALALTAGPTAPEFSSFEPVATTDMVNDLSGDFTYNIPVLNVPGPDGGGYAMSLAYHSGTSSEEEASWVGFGWTLNPGAINRNKRGYPDEFNGVQVKNYNKSKPNWTQSSNFNVNIEISSKDGDTTSSKKAAEGAEKSIKKLTVKFGTPKPEPSPYTEVVSLSFSHSVRFNNYSGFSIANGLGIGVKQMANLNMNRSGGQNTVGFSVNPLAVMGAVAKEKKVKKEGEKEKKWKTAINKGLTKISKLNEKLNKVKVGRSKLGLPSSYRVHSYNVPALPYSVAKNIGASWNFNTSIVLNPANAPLGGQIGFGGNLNIQATEGYEQMPVYGYMHSDVANTNTANNVLYDYQLEKETTFSKNDKNIGIPFNNADVFSSTGNNIMGGFRLHYDQIGTYYPNFHSSTTQIRQLGVELGIGANVQVGLDVGLGIQTTKVKGKWPELDPAALFGGAYTPTFSPSAPKMRFSNDMGGELDYNPNSDYDEAITSTISVLGDLGTPSQLFDLTANATKNKTSSDIQYYTNNNLITGMTITNKDGGKSNYTKGIYTQNEADLTVGISNNQDGAYLVANTLEYDEPMKNSTVVGSKTSQKYANSYLLESNTTFNYIDVNNNGKTDAEDFGGWTKFDYKEAY
ncbi:MAG: hypothetical protein ABIP51_06255, partial [Bacteroidia bacterium]